MAADCLRQRIAAARLYSFSPKLRAGRWAAGTRAGRAARFLCSWFACSFSLRRAAQLTASTSPSSPASRCNCPSNAQLCKRLPQLATTPYGKWVPARVYNLLKCANKPPTTSRPRLAAFLSNNQTFCDGYAGAVRPLPAPRRRCWHWCCWRCRPSQRPLRANRPARTASDRLVSCSFAPATFPLLPQINTIISDVITGVWPGVQKQLPASIDPGDALKKEFVKGLLFRHARERGSAGPTLLWRQLPVVRLQIQGSWGWGWIHPIAYAPTARPAAPAHCLVPRGAALMPLRAGGVPPACSEAIVDVELDRISGLNTMPKPTLEILNVPACSNLSLVVVSCLPRLPHLPAHPRPGQCVLHRVACTRWCRCVKREAGHAMPCLTKPCMLPPLPQANLKATSGLAKLTVTGSAGATYRPIFFIPSPLTGTAYITITLTDVTLELSAPATAGLSEPRCLPCRVPVPYRATPGVPSSAAARLRAILCHLASDPRKPAPPRPMLVAACILPSLQLWVLLATRPAPPSQSLIPSNSPQKTPGWPYQAGRLASSR